MSIKSLSINIRHILFRIKGNIETATVHLLKGVLEVVFAFLGCSNLEDGALQLL